jgi:hypothetical protein
VLDGTTTHAPEGRQQAAGHGLGKHAVNGPSHVPLDGQPWGVVIVQAPLAAQHAPRQGVGVQDVRPGSR